MIWADLQKAVQNWIVAGSGFDAAHVIWSDQAAPRPDVPWISIRLVSMPIIGRDWVDIEFNTLTVADLDIDTVDFANDELDIAAHGLETGDGPLQLATTGTLPTGLALTTDYWVIRVSVGTIQLADTFVHAISAVPTAITIDDAGTGVHTLHDTSETCRAGEEINHTARGTRILNLSVQCFASAPLGDVNPLAVLNNVISAARRPLNIDRLNAAKLGFLGCDAVQSVGGALGSAEWEPRAVVNVRLSMAQESTETGTFIETVDPPVRQ